ncbi:hypothetical protein O181_101624 [Austropuccinia psidii MF-1]|uniref:Uncharacterized protein n=1 Tax=Austropuccinia psidii MF-1 TaxID=1389203 RepID=A0A9Q3JHJ7_9BASI|nr:hypothetical protein [Austropuccinia psidii MF-1]
MYGMAIFNRKNRYLTIGKSKDEKSSFNINHMTNDKIRKDLLEDFKIAQYGTHLTSNMKLNSVNVLGKCRKAFVIGDELLGKIGGHDIELYLDLERAYPPMVKRPTYPDSLGTRKEA